MHGSLKDQLRQAGLLKKQQNQPRKKKSKSRSADPAAQQRQAELDALARHKKERDRELNQQRERQRAAQEQSDWFRQLLSAHALPKSAQAEDAEPFNFPLDNKIHRIYVDARTRAQLSNAVLGIAWMDRRYHLLPAEVAARIAAKIPKRIWLARATDPAAATEDPYAEFQVPDDLVW